MHDPDNPLSGAQLTQLLANLNPERIASRKQGGATLSYLEAWDVRASLIKVFGFGGWSAETLEVEILRMAQDAPAFEYNQNRNAPKVQKKGPLGEPVFNWVVAAKALVRLTIHQVGAVYAEAAVASQTGPDVGEVSDFAVKTAESDAFKRCAMNLGTTFGLSLYNNGATADVVKATRDPEQARILRQYAEEQQRKRTDNPAAPVAVGDHMEVSVPDESMTPAALAAATDQVGKAFSR